MAISGAKDVKSGTDNDGGDNSLDVIKMALVNFNAFTHLQRIIRRLAKNTYLYNNG